MGIKWALRGLLTLVLITPLMGARGVAAPRDHPLVAPYEGSVLSRRDDAGHSDYKVVTGVDPAAKTDDEAIQTTGVSGDLTRLFYENPRGRSPLEVFANYKAALEGAGFQILFQCAEGECGPGWAGSRWGRVTGMKYVSGPMRYLSARRAGDAGAIYVALSVMKPRQEIDILEVKGMETGLVKITAEALRKGLESQGRVVLEGLYFDSDKASLKAESRPALDEIARFLQADAGVNVYIVGHTDMDGSHEHNMALSLGRANAVVDALVTDYEIPGARLSAHGVGPLCPQRSNRSGDGKAGNRRVEMVAR